MRPSISRIQGVIPWADRHKQARRGITLVEIFVATLIVLVVMGVLYRVFSSSTRIMQAGMWTTKAQGEVRNTLTFLRDEIGRASVFATVSLNGVTPDTGPTSKIRFKNGTISAAYTGELLTFYQCRAAIAVGATPDPGAKVKCVVKKAGSQLLYTKSKEAGSGTTPEKLFSNKVLLDDLTEMQMKSLSAASNEQMAKAMLEINLTVTDPKKTGRTVNEETKAKTDVEVQAF